jgi:two-component system cell cycle response regulator
VGSSDKHQAFKTMPLDDRSMVGDKVIEALKAPWRPALVVIRGAHMGQVRKLDGTITVGRDPEAELVLTDVGVSWHHSRVEDRGDSWAVIDLESTNGTFVNGSRTSECTLQPGDRLAFGPVLARFEVQDALDQAYDDFVEKMLSIDDLSGLYVRRKFEPELEAMIVAARASGGSAGLLVMDLDGVKAINDTHGHLFGAYVIGEAGHVIGRVIEGAGVGTRFGGDEFCAALPGFDTAQTAALGEQILAAINNHPFIKDSVVLHPGISIGAASFPADAPDRSSLFQRADEALYRAKQRGKNRVCR